MSPALETFSTAFRPGLETVLSSVLKASGTIAAKDLKKTLLKANAGPAEIKGWAFDATDPHAVDWVKQHAGETITGMNKATVEDIRDLVADAFEQQYDVDELSSKIADLIGDEARAEVIARTETMRASNEGQQEAWDQATESGLLTGDEKQEWIVTPDDRLCPICEPMDGVQVGLDELFDVDGDQVDGPPAHPNCRCTIGLVAAGE